jgi:hypothetical protein
MGDHNLYVSASVRVQDDEVAAFKLGATRIAREPSVADTETLAQFEADVTTALESTSTTVTFPLGLDPLTVSVKLFYNFLAVHDTKQLHIEYYPTFCKLVTRFVGDGTYLAKEDVVSVSWRNSMWPDGVGPEARMRIASGFITMGTMTIADDTDQSQDRDHTTVEFEYRQHGTERQRHDKEVRVREKFGNKTVTTIEKKSMSQTNHKYVRYLIQQRRRKCESLSSNWNSLLTNHNDTRKLKRKWTKALNQPTPSVSGNAAKRREQEKLLALQEELADLKCALLAVKSEREKKELCNMAISIDDFLEEAHNLCPTSATDKLLLATTTPGATVDESRCRILMNGSVVPMSTNWKSHLNPTDVATLSHGVQHKFPRREQFMQKNGDELELTIQELTLKENCVRRQVHQIAQSLKRQIRVTKNKIATFPAEESWERLHRNYQRSRIQ